MYLNANCHSAAHKDICGFSPAPITYILPIPGSSSETVLGCLLFYRARSKMSYDAEVLIPTLIGSILSCVATTCVLISYVIYANQQKSFRHALVLNLALAGKYSAIRKLAEKSELTIPPEFINSLNNSISGLYVLTRGPTTPGVACTLNGWVGQWSVQVRDISGCI